MISIEEKCNMLGFIIQRKASYYYVYNNDGKLLKNCHGYKKLYEFTYRKYKQYINKSA